MDEKVRKVFTDSFYLNNMVGHVTWSPAELTELNLSSLTEFAALRTVHPVLVCYSSTYLVAIAIPDCERCPSQVYNFETAKITYR